MPSRRRYAPGFGPNSLTGQILRRLLQGCTLTGAEAWQEFRVLHLDQHIYRIRKAGVVVESMWERNSRGFHVRYRIPRDWRADPNGWDPRKPDWSPSGSDQSN